MNLIYKVPGYILCLLGGFFLSWGGLIIRSFETNDIWQILLIRSLFFIIALTAFLFLTYKKNTINILSLIFNTCFSINLFAKEINIYSHRQPFLINPF